MRHFLGLKSMKLKAVAAAAIGAVAFCFGAAPDGGLGFAAATAQGQSVRPEVGKPLQAAAALIKSGKYKDALAKLREVEAVGGRTANENYMLESMRVAAASGAGDADTMVRSFEVMKSSGNVAAAEQLRIMESIAGTYLRNNENGKALSWAQRYFKEGGNSATMKQVLQNAQFLTGDMASTIKDVSEEINADEKAGRTPSADKLNLLLNAAMRAKDGNAEAMALEKLLAYYPKKEYWADVLGRVQRKSTFSDRFALDVYRLQLATGNMKSANDYMEMSQLAVQAGSAAEGKDVVDKGFAAGVLGAGAEGERHKRLRDLMIKRLAESKAGEAEAEAQAKAAKDGNALANLGLGVAYNGQAAKGAKLIEEGIAKGSLKRPEDAKLHLGLAHMLAGDVSKAQQTWRSVRGNDGAADLARLWVIQSRSAKR